MTLSKHRIAILFCGIAIAAIVIAGWQILSTQGATYIWDNGAGNNLWSDCDNWSTNVCPGNTDIAQFDGTTSSDPATIDGAFGGTVAGIDILASYGGTITQARSLTVGTSNFIQAGGTFTGSADTIDINGSLTVSGGTFTSTSGNLLLQSHFTQSGTGVFAHNGGTVTIDGPGNQLNVDTSITLNNLIFALSSGASCITNSDGDIYNVVGTLTLTEGNFCGGLRVDASGPITVGSSFEGGPLGTLNVIGGTGNIALVGGAFLPAVNVSVDRDIIASGTGAGAIAGSLTLSNGADFVGSAQNFTIYGSLNLSDVGTSFTAPSGTLLLGNNGGSATDTFTIDSSATFLHNSGTVEFHGRNTNVDINTSLTLNNVIVDLFLDSRSLSVLTGDTLVVEGTLTLEDGLINGPGSIEAQGPITHIGTFGSCIGGSSHAGNMVIEVTSGTAVTLVADGQNEACFTGIELNHPSATLTTLDDPVINYFGGDIIVTQGTLTLGTGKVILQNDATFADNGGAVVSTDSLVVFNGDVQGIESTDPTTLHDILIASESFTFPTGDPVVITGTVKAVGQSNGLTTEIYSDTLGVQANVDLTGASNAFLQNVDLSDINVSVAAMAGSAECHFSCSAGGNTGGITFDKTIFISSTVGAVREAGATSDTFDVTLSHRPEDILTVTILSADPTQATASASAGGGNTLVFTAANWQIPQSVTVTAVDDGLNDGSADVAITLDGSSTDDEYNSATIPHWTVTVEDDDSETDEVEFDNDTDYELEDNIVVLENALALDEDTYTGATASPSLNDGGDIVYDSINDSLWFAGSASNIYEYNISSATLHSYSTGTGVGHYLAHDSEPTRNRFWLSIESTDQVVVFEDDGSIAQTFATNGEVGFADTPSRMLFDNQGDAVTANDTVWIGTENSSGIPSVLHMNAVTIAYAAGSLIPSTYPLTDQTNRSTSNRILAMTYDPTDDAIWVAFEDEFNDSMIVKLDAADGSPFNGTFENSTFPLADALFNGTYFQMEYDPTNDLVWFQSDDFIIALDADDGSIENSINTGVIDVANQVNTSTLVDYTNNHILVSTAQGDIYVYDIETGVRLNTFSSSLGAGDIVYSADGRLWALHAEMLAGEVPIGLDFLSSLYTGAPEDTYLSTVTGSGSAIDSSFATDLTGVTATETLNGQFASYSLSFDGGNTYSVWGSWREIASNQASVHGGVNGTWYSRDSGNIWTAASTNNAQTALSEAVAAGVINQMSSTVLNALDEANLELAGGWNDTVDTIYLGATLFTNNFQQNPRVENVAFSFTGGGGGGGGGGGSTGSAEHITPTNVSVNSSSCTPSTSLSLRLQGSDIQEFVISEDMDFIGAEWQGFVPTTEGTAVGNNGRPIQIMDIAYALSSGDGPKTVYVRFRSSTGNQTGRFSFGVALDETTQCAETPPEDVEGEEEAYDVIGCSRIQRPGITEKDRNTYLFGISPTAGSLVPGTFIFPGDHVRDASSETVYCITEEFERRPYVDEITYFTHARSFEDVKWVSDATMNSYPVGAAMLPQIDVALLKFRSEPNVYYLDAPNAELTSGILRWLTTEEIAEAMAGEDWNQYVIDVNDDLSSYFTMGEPFESVEQLQEEELDLSSFRKRELLNEASADQTDGGFTSLIRQIEARIGSAAKSLIQRLRQLF